MSHLLAILCEYPTLLGGERSMLATIESIAAYGFHPVLLAPGRGPLADAGGKLGLELFDWSVHDEHGSRRPPHTLRDELAAILHELKPALLHANSLAMGRLSGPVADRIGVASISHLRDILRLSRAAVADLNRHTRLLAVSQATADYHIAQGLDAAKTHVCYNGVDLELFRPRDNSGYLHQALGIDPGCHLLATIGQVGPRKGTDRFLDVARRVSPSRGDVHWLVVGTRTSTKQEAIDFEATLHDRAQRDGLKGRVHFLGTRSDVPRLLGEITLLIHAARQEPLGRVLLEAAASGVPVVATDVGGTREILPTACAAARLVDAKLAEGQLVVALARHVTRLLDDPTLHGELSAAGRRRAEAAFSAERAAECLKAQLLEVVARKPGIWG